MSYFIVRLLQNFQTIEVDWNAQPEESKVADAKYMETKPGQTRVAYEVSGLIMTMKVCLVFF